MDNNKFNGTKGLHIIHLNIRSLWANYEFFKHYLSASNVACATLSETWLHENIPSTLLSIDDYDLVRQDRTVRNTATNKTKSGGGLAIYIHNSLTYSTSELEHLNCCSTDIEMQWLTLTKPHMKKIVVANIYRPPSGSVGNFTDSLYACFDALSKYKEHDIFLLGDMNIDMNPPFFITNS